MKPILQKKTRDDEKCKEIVVKSDKKKKQILVDVYAFVCDNEDSICSYIDTNLKVFRRDVKPTLKITDLYISAISAKAKISISFDLPFLYTHLESYCKKHPRCAIKGLILADSSYGIIKKPRKKAKGFPNCLSFVIESKNGKNVTGKIFSDKKNEGNSISMVGCRVEEDGISIIQKLQDIINILFTNTKCTISKFEKTMINSNYSIGCKIDRELLFSFLSDHYPMIFSSYTPASGYTAVKLGFYYNAIKKEQDGVCACPGRKCTLKKSSGKGSGEKVGDCKKVTISIFESGIIITGGRHIYQNISAYNFINSIITKNITSFAHIDVSFPEENTMFAAYVTIIPLL